MNPKTNSVADQLKKRYDSLRKGSHAAIRARGELVAYVDTTGLDRASYGLKTWPRS